jgi:hypothetical protein
MSSATTSSVTTPFTQGPSTIMSRRPLAMPLLQMTQLEIGQEM